MMTHVDYSNNCYSHLKVVHSIRMMVDTNYFAFGVDAKNFHPRLPIDSIEMAQIYPHYVPNLHLLHPKSGTGYHLELYQLKFPDHS